MDLMIWIGLILLALIVGFLWFVRRTQEMNHENVSPPSIVEKSTPSEATVRTSLSSSVPASRIAGIFLFFAFLGFLVFGFGSVIFFISLGNNNENDQRLSFQLLILGLSSGIGSLASWKIISCLHESAYRLRSIQAYLTSQKGDGS
jgi:hypothetical protein